MPCSHVPSAVGFAYRVQEWTFDSDISFAKCVGGLPGAEGVLTGCSNGHVHVVYLDNAFPVLLWEHNEPIAMAALSTNKRVLALVDTGTHLSVIDLDKASVRTR